MQIIKGLIITCLLFASSVSSKSSTWEPFQRDAGTTETKRSDYEVKVVGGKEVPKGKYPFVASLNLSGQNVCGASIIDPYWVLTAGHCTNKMNHFQIGVETNRHNLYLTLEEDGAQYHEVEFFALVSSYDTPKDPKGIYINSDISILRLKNPINNITLINLDRTGSYSLTGTNAIIAGWGLTSEKGNTSQIPLEAVVPIVDGGKCEAVYPGIAVNTTSFCAGYDEGKIDACLGDRGGPLFISSNGSYYQVGISSSGNGCARPNAYGTYARVLIGFIDRYMKSYSSNPCSSNPCRNGGLCNSFDNNNQFGYTCACSVTHTGYNCLTPVCDGIDCFIDSFSPNYVIGPGETYRRTFVFGGLPTKFNKNAIRFLTSTYDLISAYNINITSPSGDIVYLSAQSQSSNCYISSSWDYLVQPSSSCPSKYNKPNNNVDFTGKNMNGNWTISIHNGHSQKIGLIGWGVYIENIKSCSSSEMLNCQNGGSCVSIFGKSSCDCVFPFTGNLCEISPCSPNPCVHGKCSFWVGNSTFSCQCDPGYDGTRCDYTSDSPQLTIGYFLYISIFLSFLIVIAFSF